MEANKIIKAMRIYLGMTQAEAAEQVGISLKDYQKYEDCDGYIMSGKFSEVCKIIEVMQLNPKKFYREKYELDERAFQELISTGPPSSQQRRAHRYCAVYYITGRNRDPEVKFYSTDLK